MRIIITVESMENDVLMRAKSKDLNQYEDSGGAEVQGIQAIDQVQLESHQDQGEEQEKVEDGGQP